MQNMNCQLQIPGRQPNNQRLIARTNCFFIFIARQLLYGLISFAKVVLLLLVFIPVIHAAPVIVGHVSFAKGSNAAQITGSQPRLIASGAQIYQGDNIQTADSSFVIIEFTDGSKITVRPNSSFSIEHFDNSKAQMVLHEGGVRASTGAVAAKNPENFQIKGNNAVVNAQQADYSVRLCNDDCKSGQNTGVKKANASPDKTIAARVVDIKGNVYAVSQSEKNASPRLLSLGSPLYASDTVKSQQDSYALMVFSDGGKITLNASSEMKISAYNFQEESDENKAVYRLTKGGMRVLTGKIGKVRNPGLSVDTPVATIGIRGTGFDLNCAGKCSENQKPQHHKILKGLQNGLYSFVWRGEITQTNEQGQFVLSVNRSNFIANSESTPIPLLKLPDIFFNNTSPRPDTHKSSFYQLHSLQNNQGTPPGLYVLVHTGNVQLKTENPDNIISLGKNKEGYVSPDGNIMGLSSQQMFQSENDNLQPFEFDAHKLYYGIYSLFIDDYTVSNQPHYQCVTN
jgi:hypothetical protein